ncbi:cytochrome P450 2B4-like isoform X2 [Clupea harengus]|uniref:Cytochrome P450 2B4-like isoform X2 n=1 Tax=Clupea harengus TaxID=7950 RepID=A0A6P8EW56_CLUHA|nr:cytochrome P450 2B4-like isoform X2 [Clupea harengus]
MFAMRCMDGSSVTLAERYGPVYSLYIGPRPVVVLANLQVIREALVTRATEFAGRPDHMMISHITQCKGVIMADYGPKWQEHRRFALTTLRNFGMGKRTMEEKILEETRHICTELEKHAGKSMDPQYLFHYAASDIICSVIFGSRFDYDDPYFKKLIVMIVELTTLILDPWAMIYEIAPFMRRFPLPFNRAFDVNIRIKSHIFKVVSEHKDSWVSGQPRDLIDCYLDEMEKRADKGTSFEDSQLVAILFDLLLAGTDTTSNTLRTATLYLMTHPHIQERCYQEIEEVLGSREQVLFEDRHAMPYVQAMIHEAQRVADTVPLSVFHTTTADTHIQGYSIPKGTMIIPYLSSALHEEGQWKSPHDFNPDNFLNERGEFVKPDAFMPFSTGSRMCLGEGLARMELFLILVTLLRRFRLVWPEERGVPDYGMVLGGTLAPKPFQVTVHLRGA